jgi:predicted dehydrogenase
MNRQTSSRREFLLQSSSIAAGAMTAPYFFATQKSLAQESKSAGDRPHIGQIGCGGQGNGITNGALRYGDVLAVCDVDSRRAEQAKARQGKGKADIYEDYRKVLDRKDIDVVTIGTPDHWHTKIAIEAMQAGKDIYCEKPLTLTIDEGKLICRVAKETKRVFQVGTQQRSDGPFAKAVAMCRDGRIGKVREIHVAIGGGETSGPLPKVDPPASLNWEMWLGQAPLVDYIAESRQGRGTPKSRCHYEFRWWFEYSGGKMTDWGAHHVDIAHWLIDAHNTSPVSFEGTAEFPVPFSNGYPTVDNRYNTATRFNIRTKFADGAQLIIADRIADQAGTGVERIDRGNGVLVIGESGEFFVSRDRLVGKPVDALGDKPLSDDLIAKVRKGAKRGHMEDFFDCIKTRKEPVSDVFSHHRAMTTCHLANICIRLGRPIKWDPEKEQVVGDEEANRWLAREQRKGYEIKV